MGIKYGLYEILNVNHDNSFYNKAEDKLLQYGEGFYPNKRNIIKLEKFIYNVWNQISTAFNNGYDHHLIFKRLNETRFVGTEFEWSFDSNKEVCIEACLNIKLIFETNC